MPCSPRAKRKVSTKSSREELEHSGTVDRVGNAKTLIPFHRRYRHLPHRRRTATMGLASQRRYVSYAPSSLSSSFSFSRSLHLSLNHKITIHLYLTTPMRGHYLLDKCLIEPTRLDENTFGCPRRGTFRGPIYCWLLRYTHRWRCSLNTLLRTVHT